MFKTTFALLLTSGVTLASQDSAFYPNFANPNVKNHEMYYRESVNVLQDMMEGEFDSLFIRYHGCVWSEYGSGSGENKDQGNCGGDGGDEHWYMGRTQCYRPNVAYTLYGVKHGAVVPKEGVCSKKHYINSFFTSYGIESFGDSIGFEYGNYGAETGCEAEEGDDDGNQQNQQNNGGDKDNYVPEHNEQIYAGYTSSGLACSAEGQFVTATFSGAFCEGRHFQSVTGSFTEMNGALDSLGCVMIFNNGTTFEDEYHAAYYNGDDEGQEDDGDIEDSMAWTLLTASSACSTTQYPKRCPDPWGAKSRRDSALRNSALAAGRNIPLVMPIMTGLMIFIALFFFKKSNDLKQRLIRKSLEEDPMDQARGTDSSPTGANEIALVLSSSFARTITGLSARTRSVKEALIAYAEEQEEEDIEGYTSDAKVFSSPPEEAAKEGDEDVHDDGVSVISMVSKAATEVSKAATEASKVAAVALAGAVAAATGNEETGEATETGTVASKAGTVASKTGTVASKAGTVASKAGTVTSKAGTVASKAGTVTSKAGESVASEAHTVTISVDGTINTAPAVLSPRSKKLLSSDEDEEGVLVANNDAVANAMLAEKGILPPRPPKKQREKKKFKRPRMAKMTKLLFRGRRKSLGVSPNRAEA